MENNEVGITAKDNIYFGHSMVEALLSSSLKIHEIDIENLENNNIETESSLQQKEIYDV